MPVYTNDEQGVVGRFPLFLLLRQVIVRTACYSKSSKQIKKMERLCLATLTHHYQCRDAKTSNLDIATRAP